MTAAAEYKQAATACTNAIARLQTVMHTHAERQKATPTYWSHVADLKKARLDLLHLMAFLGDLESRETLHAEGESR